MSNADAVIAALRSGYEDLAVLAVTLSDADLAAPSGASEWDVAQVLGHLGSGAEINQATITAAVAGKPNPGLDFARSVWARWDALGRRDLIDGFQSANEALIDLYESLDEHARENLRIEMGFLPEPVDVAMAGRLRLSEFTLHAWDVRVGFDKTATLSAEGTAQIAAGVGAMVGWLAKPDAVKEHSVIRVTTTEPDLDLALRLAGEITAGEITGEEITGDQITDGTLSLPAEAWVRLVTGRLGPGYTPAGITATGAADLDLLRRVFPGF
ncbi:MAG: maleylpyruvate isomerase family mycothiol-dependent enzyme [Trebonia sp.]